MSTEGSLFLRFFCLQLDNLLANHLPQDDQGQVHPKCRCLSCSCLLAECWCSCLLAECWCSCLLAECWCSCLLAECWCSYLLAECWCSCLLAQFRLQYWFPHQPMVPLSHRFPGHYVLVLLLESLPKFPGKESSRVQLLSSAHSFVPNSPLCNSAGVYRFQLGGDYRFCYFLWAMSVLLVECCFSLFKTAQMRYKTFVYVAVFGTN